jgi:hypothetical protein
MDGLVMVLRNNRGEYLFAEEAYEEVYYTLLDKEGEVLSAGILPMQLDIFMYYMYKAGYDKVNF